STFVIATCRTPVDSCLTRLRTTKYKGAVPSLSLTPKKGEVPMRAPGFAVVVAVTGFLLLPGSAPGQSASTGSIAGVVRDTTGAVLPGVTVEAASPALIEKVRSVVSDQEGQYKILEL